MFTKLPESEGAALGVRLSGKITTEMEEELINVCNQVIEEHNTIDFLVHLDEHARWGVKAGIEDLKWALTHIKNIGKVAIVADSQFYKWYVALNQPFAKMVGIQEEYFKPDAIDEAWAWVKG